jgi:hypothetical protein
VKSSRTYTVREVVEDWPRWGLDSAPERTPTLYKGLPGPALEMIGASLRVTCPRATSGRRLTSW